MKILCVADETDSLVYSPSSKRLFGDCDFVISAGDLPLRYYDFIMTIMGKQLYYVYGNHNLEQFKENVLKVQTPATNDFNSPLTSHYSGELIDGKCIYDKKRDLIIMGLGGSMLYNYGLSQYSEKQMKWRINKLVPRLLYNKQKYGRYVDILVTHAPVLGMGDGVDVCHRGFECFKTFIDKYKPKYLLHGHVHLFDENENRFYKYGETTIINVYKSFVLDDTSLGRQNG
ncbi:metallophosphoesterase [Spirochaetales bacterium NM-380-WT-3C1]|uniref:Metallophosphoesterase n=1 Tax=Bullifex porci TaxID=2606638 RepID=A0A7X2TQ39_9SPIO|nr:metallophosphoesterase [Bullifex porci]MSU06081.1 metallophosphoesterase [Bullifex porci]